MRVAVGPGRGRRRRDADDEDLDSPDDADVRALTFAQQVAPVKKVGPLVPIGGDFYLGGERGWMG